MRLGRSRRLRKGPEFERVFKEGVAVGGPFLLLRHAPNGLAYSRWGFAVGKKAVPDAVDRNRVRRQLKAAAQALGESGPGAGADIVVILRPAGVGKTYAELCRDLESVLRRAGFGMKGDGQ
jgi:ribonuclease P protein component